jgi:penicillin-binding protein 2
MPQQKLPLKNTQRELKLYYQRLGIIIIILTIMTCALFTRLLALQFLEHDRYSTLSNQNQLGLISIEPSRGFIYDRNGIKLAENIQVFSLDIIPAKVTNLHKTFTELSKLVNISPEDKKAFFRAESGKKRFQPIPLRFNLSEEEISKFSIDQWRFPGVMLTSSFMRYYPFGGTMVSVLGFMSRINEQELGSLDSINYSASSQMGKVGIEKHFENLLHGQVGYMQVETDASGRVVRMLKRIPPVSGTNIYLTIDSELQKATQKAFGDQIGAAVAIAPETGEILTLYSNPTYDPNLFVKGISTSEYKSLGSEPGKPLYNRAIRGLYAPGSTAKPFMALKGLLSGLVTEDDTIFDPGYFVYGHHMYRDSHKGGHGIVNLKKAITVSCDTYFYNLGIKIGIYRMADILTQFGFGQRTQLEEDEELRGLVPTPEWKKKIHKEKWYMGDTITAGIGQGYLLITPMQLAGAVATLANNGNRMQPHLLLKMQTPNQEIIATKPQILRSSTIPEKDLKLVQEGMIGVIQAPWGTGFRFGRNPPYSVAAKTGTAQVFHSNKRYKDSEVVQSLRDNSTFIAYAPVDHPKIAVAVVCEHSALAASIARRIIDNYLITEKHLYEKHE